MVGGGRGVQIMKVEFYFTSTELTAVIRVYKVAKTAPFATLRPSDVL